MQLKEEAVGKKRDVSGEWVVKEVPAAPDGQAGKPVLRFTLRADEPGAVAALVAAARELPGREKELELLIREFELCR